MADIRIAYIASSNPTGAEREALEKAGILTEDGRVAASWRVANAGHAPGEKSPQGFYQGLEGREADAPGGKRLRAETVVEVLSDSKAIREAYAEAGKNQADPRVSSKVKTGELTTAAARKKEAEARAKELDKAREAKQAKLDRLYRRGYPTPR